MKICPRCQKPFDEPHKFKMCDACRAQRREYALNYYYTHREKLLERARGYYKENPEKERKRRQRYYNLNQEKLCEIGRKYYAANPEVRKELSRAWHEANPEYSRKYYQENRQKMNEQMHENFVENRVYYREKCRRWCQEHPEKVYAYSKRWADANPEKIRAYSHNRRTRLRGICSDLQEDIEEILFTKQEGRCYLCGELLYGRLNDIPTIEHKTPITRGGTNDIENIGLAHKSCNSRKHTKTPEEYLELLANRQK